MAKARAAVVKLINFGALVMALALMVGISFTLFQRTASAQTTPQSPVQVKWEIEGAPAEGRVGLRLVIPRLKLTNTGTQPWFSAGANEYKIGYRWFYGYGALIPQDGPNGYDEVRANLPQDIPPGGGIIYPNFQVGVPKEPGDYVLHIDLVQPQQNNAWLQSKGVKDLEVKVTVKARDAKAPLVQMTALPLYTTSTAVQVSWSGKEEDGGTGLNNFDVQYKTATDAEWTNWLTGTTLTTATFQGENGKVYQFRVRATDKSGNASEYLAGGNTFTRVNILPPSSAVDTLPTLSPSAFLVRWSSFDVVDGANKSLYDVQYRDGDTGSWINWLTGTPGTAALFQGQTGHSYSFRVRAMNYAGNRSDFPANAQARTTTSAALDTAYAGPAGPAANATGATTLYFPLATKNGDNGSGTMGFVINNPTDAPADVFIRFDNFAGVATTKTVNNQSVAIDNNEAVATNRVVTMLETIPAKSSKTVWAGNLYLPVYNGWATIVSGSPVQATAVRLGTDSRVAQYAPAPAATKLYLPFVRKGDNNNSSIIDLVNPTPAPVAVDITYYNESGAVAFTEKRELNRLASTRFTLSGLRTADPNSRFSGSAVISAPSGVAATVENFLEDGSIVTYAGQTSAVPATTPVQVYKNVDGYTTSVLIQNTGNSAVQLKIEYLNENGQTVGSLDRQLPAFGRYVAWQGVIQESSFKGSVKITATGGNIATVTVGAGPTLKDRAFP